MHTHLTRRKPEESKQRKRKLLTFKEFVRIYYPNITRTLETDVISRAKHTMYSLRHTAICMRIILSEGRVNIFNLAKNAGTSVGQIERFYARNLPLSREMARNLQSFAD